MQLANENFERCNRCEYAIEVCERDKCALETLEEDAGGWYGLCLYTTNYAEGPTTYFIQADGPSFSGEWNFRTAKPTKHMLQKLVENHIWPHL